MPKFNVIRFSRTLWILFSRDSKGNWIEGMQYTWPSLETYVDNNANPGEAVEILSKLALLRNGTGMLFS